MITRFKRGLVATTLALALTVTSVPATMPTVSAATKTTKTTQVKLNKSKVTLCEGKSITLKISGTSGKVKWSSSKSSVAKISSKGKIIAKKKGSTVIKATVNKKTYKCKVTVKEHSYDEKYCNKASTCTRCGETKKDDFVDFVPTEDQVLEDMLALQEDYPEGMSWTNDNYYRWNGGIFSGGYGCAGFAFLLSDAAFGDLPARKHSDLNNVRVGDILRTNNNSHSVVVLEVNENSVTVAEGNYNSSIHWGRTITFDELRSTKSFVYTRWP